MSQIKISVIVPMYNAEKFISKCIEHLIHQTYKNLEIIIVNDGSSDNCANIIKEYAKHDKRIKLINQKNGGVSVASNTGLKHATGDYVHIHDHDDFVNLDYFEKMADVAELTNADILCGEVNQPEYSFPVFDNVEICTTLADKINTTRANLFNPAWRYVYKKAFLDKTELQFEPSVFGAQDILFTKPAIILADTVATVPGAKYNVVNTPTALGKDKKRFDKNNTDANRAAWAKYYKFISEHGASELLSAPEKPYHQEFFKVFNKTIFRRDIYTQKVKSYLFGINIGTKKII